MNAPLLWHGSGSGDGDAVLRSIMHEGVRKQYSHPDKNMQAAGVYFAVSRQWAADYTLRLQDPLHLYRRKGKPFLVAVPFAPSDDWDIDYEQSYQSAIDFLKPLAQQLESFPANRLRVTVLKKNLPMFHQNLKPEEREDVVADWMLQSITVQDSGPVLNFSNLRDPSGQPKITIGWDGQVQGAGAKTGSFANVLEQLVYFYRDLDRAAFRDFIAAEVARNPGLSLKYTGAAPLAVVAAEIKNGDTWESFRA